ncbi:MAG: biotin/lipoyl-containing protein [Pseudomonadota bacterium]
MPIQILMPALSPTMEEGTLAKWNVAVGDEVRSGDVIAEIETDKATMEVEAVDEGVVGQILVAAGTEGVSVNKPIAVLLEEGESADDLGDAGASASAVGGALPAEDDEWLGTVSIFWIGAGVFSRQPTALLNVRSGVSDCEPFTRGAPERRPAVCNAAGPADRGAKQH